MVLKTYGRRILAGLQSLISSIYSKLRCRGEVLNSIFRPKCQSMLQPRCKDRTVSAVCARASPFRSPRQGKSTHRQCCFRALTSHPHHSTGERTRRGSDYRRRSLLNSKWCPSTHMSRSSMSFTQWDPPTTTTS